MLLKNRGLSTVTVFVLEDRKQISSCTFISLDTQDFTVSSNADGALRVAAGKAAVKNTGLTVTFANSNTAVVYMIND